MDQIPKHCSLWCVLQNLSVFSPLKYRQSIPLAFFPQLRVFCKSASRFDRQNLENTFERCEIVTLGSPFSPHSWTDDSQWEPSGWMWWRPGQLPQWNRWWLPAHRCRSHLHPIAVPFQSMSWLSPTNASVCTPSSFWLSGCWQSCPGIEAALPPRGHCHFLTPSTWANCFP